MTLTPSLATLINLFKLKNLGSFVVPNSGTNCIGVTYDESAFDLAMSITTIMQACKFQLDDTEWPSILVARKQRSYLVVTKDYGATNVLYYKITDFSPIIGDLLSALPEIEVERSSVQFVPKTSSLMLHVPSYLMPQLIKYLSGIGYKPLESDTRKTNIIAGLHNPKYNNTMIHISEDYSTLKIF
jgi:hypothetical protein